MKFEERKKCNGLHLEKGLEEKKKMQTTIGGGREDGEDNQHLNMKNATHMMVMMQ